MKIPISATVEMHSLALKMREQGQKIFSLAAGEPKIKITKFIPALSRAEFGYPPVSGLKQLRVKASQWVNKNYGCDYRQDETSVVPGAKMGIFLLLRAILKPGDRVAVIAPYWVSYPPMIELCYGRPLILKTSAENNWKITEEAIQNLNPKKCKALIINNASNPCAVLYAKNELRAILSAAAKKGLFVISDEVYSELVYNEKFYSCGQFKKFKDNLAVVQSCSKNFAMPGIRTGFVFAPVQIIKLVNALNGHTTSGVSQLSQAACLAAFKHPDKVTERVNQEMKKRRNLMHQLLKKYWKKSFKLPSSALYFFLKASDLHSGYQNDEKFCSDLLKKNYVAIVPGMAFGQKGYVRLSFGAEAYTIKKALHLLAKFCGKS